MRVASPNCILTLIGDVQSLLVHISCIRLWQKQGPHHKARFAIRLNGPTDLLRRRILGSESPKQSSPKSVHTADFQITWISGCGHPVGAHVAGASGINGNGGSAERGILIMTGPRRTACACTSTEKRPRNPFEPASTR